MAASKHDIEVTDEYTRSRRNTFFFAGFLVLLVAVPAGVTLLGVTVPAMVARAVATIAMVFSFVRFLLEWILALHRSSDLILNTNAKNLDERLGELASQFGGLVDDMRNKIASLSESSSHATRALSGANIRPTDQQMQRLAAVAGEVRNQILAMPVKMVPLPGQPPQNNINWEEVFQGLLIERIIQIYKDEQKQRINDMMQGLLPAHASMEGSLKRVADFSVQLSETMKTFRGQIGRLSGRFNFWQKVGFYGMDLVASTIMFLLGLYSAFVGLHQLAGLCGLLSQQAVSI